MHFTSRNRALRLIALVFASAILFGSLGTAYSQSDPRDRPPLVRPLPIRPNPPGIRAPEFGIVRVRILSPTDVREFRPGYLIQVGVWVKNFGGVAASVEVDVVKGPTERLPNRAGAGSIRPGQVRQFNLNIPVTIGYVRGREYRRTIYISRPGGRISSYPDANQRNNFHLLRVRMAAFPLIKLTEIRVETVTITRAYFGSNRRELTRTNWYELFVYCELYVRNNGTAPYDSPGYSVSKTLHANRSSRSREHLRAIVGGTYVRRPRSASGLRPLEPGRTEQIGGCPIRVRAARAQARTSPPIPPGHCFNIYVRLSNAQGRYADQRQTSFCIGSEPISSRFSAGGVITETYRVVCIESRSNPVGFFSPCRRR